ncbi:restriction endonuclease subunit S [Lysinibacillus telephonicus]|uniref:Restriction endonuclease subunit S n=1 Tax=Lysinibacillus telephonicus TaxID=1714840 RepID=A0A431UTI0_9BACI|nr:restriction endonuclease subunit S [Lysinibacillus telephonicus]RTQ93801.1 restriction endonuclease subunit S [Lysinibacillus telephonicus]
MNNNYNSSNIEQLAKIPKNWKVVKWKYLSNEPMMYGANESAELDDRDLPRYIRITDLDSYGNLKDDTFKSLPFDKAKGYMLINGDILLARSGATVGKAYIHKDDLDACFAGYLIRYRPNQSKIKPQLVYYYTQTGLYADWIRENTIQATIQNVSAEKYANLSMPVPPLEEQGNIVYFLDNKTSEIDSLIADKEKLIELLEEKRQAIITEAVTKGLNPSVKMKDSGVEWIGEIPEHWEINKLKYLVYLRNEKVIDNYTLPYVGLENIESKTGNFNPSLGIEEQLVEGTSNAFYSGDVLFGKLRPYLAKCFVANFEGKCTTELLVMKTKENIILNEYLKFLLLTDIYIQVINSSTYGAKMPRANWDFISNLLIPLPNIKEQMEIIKNVKNEITTIDELREELKLQIEKIKEYRQSLIYEAVTGKIDVREYKKVLS